MKVYLKLHFLGIRSKNSWQANEIIPNVSLYVPENESINNKELFTAAAIYNADNIVDNFTRGVGYDGVR